MRYGVRRFVAAFLLTAGPWRRQVAALQKSCDCSTSRLFRYDPDARKHEQFYEGEVAGGFDPLRSHHLQYNAPFIPPEIQSTAHANAMA